MSNLYQTVNQKAAQIANQDPRLPSDIQGEIFSTLNDDRPSIVYNTSISTNKTLLDQIAKDAITQAIADEMSSLIGNLFHA